MAGELAIDSECTGVRLKIATKRRFMKAYAKEKESFSVALGRYLDNLVKDVKLQSSDVAEIDSQIAKNYKKRMEKRLKKSAKTTSGGAVIGRVKKA